MSSNLMSDNRGISTQKNDKTDRKISYNYNSNEDGICDRERNKDRIEFDKKVIEENLDGIKNSKQPNYLNLENYEYEKSEF